MKIIYSYEKRSALCEIKLHAQSSSNQNSNQYKAFTEGMALKLDLHCQLALNPYKVKQTEYK